VPGAPILKSVSKQKKVWRKKQEQQSLAAPESRGVDEANASLRIAWVIEDTEEVTKRILNDVAHHL